MTIGLYKTIPLMKIGCEGAIMTEYEMNIDLLTGVMLGIEFPSPKDIDEDLLFACVLDLFIFRFVFLKWKASE